MAGLLTLVEQIHNVMRDYVTDYDFSRQPDNNARLKRQYLEYRAQLMTSQVADILPQSVKSHDTLHSFDQSMRNLGGYQVRRTFLKEEFDPILNKLRAGQLIDELVASNQAHRQQRTDRAMSNPTEIRPVFGPPRNDKQFRCDVFVIMPFSGEFNAVYQNVILPVGQERTLKVIRGDDFVSNNHIIDEIWSGIFHSRLVIADCTGSNPNVFYELGIVHTIGRPTVLITQDIGTTPFDVKSRRLIHYENSIAGVPKLKAELGSVIDRFLADS